MRCTYSFWRLAKLNVWGKIIFRDDGLEAFRLLNAAEVASRLVPPLVSHQNHWRRARRREVIRWLIRRRLALLHVWEMSKSPAVWHRGWRVKALDWVGTAEVLSRLENCGNSGSCNRWIAFNEPSPSAQGSCEQKFRWISFLRTLWHQPSGHDQLGFCYCFGLIVLHWAIGWVFILIVIEAFVVAAVLLQDVILRSFLLFGDEVFRAKWQVDTEVVGGCVGAGKFLKF